MRYRKMWTLFLCVVLSALIDLNLMMCDNRTRYVEIFLCG